jgi:hypothetical protein
MRLIYEIPTHMTIFNLRSYLLHTTLVDKKFPRSPFTAYFFSLQT